MRWTALAILMVSTSSRLVVGAVSVNFGTYGIALPHTVAWCLKQLPWSATALAALLGIIVFWHLASAEEPPESSHFWTGLSFLGGVVFALGSAVFTVSHAGIVLEHRHRQQGLDCRCSGSRCRPCGFVGLGKFSPFQPFPTAGSCGIDRDAVCVGFYRQ